MACVSLKTSRVPKKSVGFLSEMDLFWNPDTHPNAWNHHRSDEVLCQWVKQNKIGPCLPHWKSLLKCGCFPRKLDQVQVVHCSVIQYIRLLSHWPAFSLSSYVKDCCAKFFLNEPTGRIHSACSTRGPTGLKVLLMEEILHHLGCIKPYEYWDI